MTDSSASLQLSGDGHKDLEMLLREALPEIKYALGDLIDRENARPLPGRYARLLPETLLIVTLRADAADALVPLAGELESELTESCTRHGSLYDRAYRVQLRRASDPDAPLFAVSAHSGQALAASVAEEREVTEAAPTRLPDSDPDATQVDWAGAGGLAGERDDWEPGRWLLVAEGGSGEDHEVFRLTEPLAIVGRRSDDPLLSTHIALSDAPHVSRRQLALVWESRDGASGFRIYNLGLNSLHLPSLQLTGARVGRAPLRLDQLADEHTGWIAPGMPFRIGEHGPTLRVEEVPAEEEDPEATQYD